MTNGWSRLFRDIGWQAANVGGRNNRSLVLAGDKRQVFTTSRPFDARQSGVANFKPTRKIFDCC